MKIEGLTAGPGWPRKRGTRAPAAWASVAGCCGVWWVSGRARRELGGFVLKELKWRCKSWFWLMFSRLLRLHRLIFLKFLDSPVENSAWEGHGGDGGASFRAALALPRPSFCPKSASQTALLSVHSHQWALIVVPQRAGVRQHCIASFCAPTNSTWFLPLYRAASIPSCTETVVCLTHTPQKFSVVMPEFGDYFNL